MVSAVAMRSSRHGRARSNQVHQYFAGILASGRVDGQVVQRESVSSINCGVSAGWEGPAAASNEQVARSQSYGFAARQLCKAIDRLRAAAQASLDDPSPENVRATHETAKHVYPAAASLLRQLNFLAESLTGMLCDVERRIGHSRAEAEDGTATPLTTLARGAADADVSRDFRKFRDRLHAIATEFDQLEAARAGGKPVPEPVQVTLSGAVQPELGPLTAPMRAVERSISRTRRKYNDMCCSLVHILGIPDLAVIVQAHVTVVDLYRCRRASQGCKEWCDKTIRAMPRLAFFDFKAGTIETLSLTPGKIGWERPLYQPPLPDDESEQEPTAAQGQDAGGQGGGSNARACVYIGATTCCLNDGRFFLAGMKAREQTGPFADDNHVHHPTWQHLDRVQLYDPRDEIEGPPERRWCRQCNAAFQCHGGIDNAHNDTCGLKHPKQCYTSRGTVPNPDYRTWKPLPPPPTPRACAQAVALSDGRVMLIGGRVPYRNAQPDQHHPTINATTIKALGDNIAVATCECYDPATNTWSTLGSMNTPRRNAAVGLLPDGKVIVAGGCCPKYVRTDPEHHPGAAQPGAAAPGHPGGAIGLGPETTIPHPVALNDVETYDPETNKWSRCPTRLANARAFCRGVVFPDGSFGVVGGGEYPDQDFTETSSDLSGAPLAFGSQVLAAMTENPGVTHRERMQAREIVRKIEVISLRSIPPHGPWYGSPDVARLCVSNAASTCIGGCLAGVAYKVREQEPEPVVYEHEHERISAEAEAEAAAKMRAEEEARALAEGVGLGGQTDAENRCSGLWDVQCEDGCYGNGEDLPNAEKKMRSVKLFGAPRFWILCVLVCFILCAASSGGVATALQ